MSKEPIRTKQWNCQHKAKKKKKKNAILCISHCCCSRSSRLSAFCETFSNKKKWKTFIAAHVYCLNARCCCSWQLFHTIQHHIHCTQKKQQIILSILYFCVMLMLFELLKCCKSMKISRNKNKKNVFV